MLQIPANSLPCCKFTMEHRAFVMFSNSSPHSHKTKYRVLVCFRRPMPKTLLCSICVHNSKPQARLKTKCSELWHKYKILGICGDSELLQLLLFYFPMVSIPPEARQIRVYTFVSFSTPSKPYPNRSSRPLSPKRRLQGRHRREPAQNPKP